MPERTPNDGGCWFCYTDDGDMEFSFEFDTFFHVKCMYDAVKKDPHNEEAQIIHDEYDSRPEAGGDDDG